jgi:hypothetical protein
MTEREGPWVGDLVLDPVGNRRGTLTDVRKGVYILRAPGGIEWPAADPTRLTVVTKRTERTDW